MIKTSKNIILIFCLLLTYQLAKAQFGYGATFTNELYNRFTNPIDTSSAYRSSGSGILNFAIGPKIWVGSESFSVSAEAQAGIGLLSLAVKDYKGLGNAYFPMMVKLNFGGLSGLDKEGKMGFSIGGGLQYSKTELYGLTDKFEQKGVSRDFFKTYFVQAGYGFGLSGFGLSGNLKYGWNTETKANIFAIGIQYDFNIPMLKKISNPSNAL